MSAVSLRSINASGTHSLPSDGGVETAASCSATGSNDQFDNFVAWGCCAAFVHGMEVPRDPTASRYEHVGRGLRRSDLNRDPVKQFGHWFTAAIEVGIRDVNAMS